MKSKIFFIFLLVVALSACQEEFHTSDATNKNVTFPDRPFLEPGASHQLIKPRSSTIVADMGTLTPQDLVDALIGSGPNTPTISNVSFAGVDRSAGIFSNATEVFGFEGGVILSNGNISNIEGPNAVDDASANNGLPGDSDLDDLISGQTNDATVLEFDFECQDLQEISFQYVFASEEYNEYVGSEFNDVFGFFVNGENIAIIPGSETAVSINNLNCGNPFGTEDAFCDFFINNDLNDGGGSIDTEADGYTVVLTATTVVNPGVNNIKLAIADVGDFVLDSHVLLKGESFTCGPPNADESLIRAVGPNGEIIDDPLQDGDVIDASLWPRFTLEYLPSEPGVGSVVMELTGPRMKTQKENSAGYYLFGNSGTSINTQFFPAGMYNIEVTSYSGRRGRGEMISTMDIDFEVVQPQMVLEFQMFNETGDLVVSPLSDGDVLVATDLPGSLYNIQAITDPNFVGSVRMEISGPVTYANVENYNPYFLFSNASDSGRREAMELLPGSYVLTGTPYNKKNAKGAAGMPLSISFTVEE